MRMIFSLFSLLILSHLNAQPPAGKATRGSVYGAKTDAQNAISAEQLPALLRNKDTIQVKVKSKVSEVCTKKGCWMTFRVNDSTEAFVKMRDYGFFVPVDLAGKTAVI